MSTGKQFGFERWQILVSCFQQIHTCQAAFSPTFPHFPQCSIIWSICMDQICNTAPAFPSVNCLPWWSTKNFSYLSQRFLPEFPIYCWKSSQIQQKHRTNSWQNGQWPSWWQKKATWGNLFLDLWFFTIFYLFVSAVCFCFFLKVGNCWKESGKCWKWETKSRKLKPKELHKLKVKKNHEW